MVESGEAFRDMRERLGACFPELSVQETERLASAARMSSYAKGEWICVEGGCSTVTCWLVSGHVELLKGSMAGKNTVLHVVRPGHFLDLYGVLGGGAAFLSARTLSPCEVLGMENRVFRALLAENMGLAQRVMRALAVRQRMFINKIAVSQGKISVRRRVAGWLLHKARVEKSTVLEDVITREVLAGLLGLSRESLSRQLSRFAQEGMIRLERRTIVLTDEAALRRCLMEE
ncbi:Crp/Fnr family transcriptional regulator [uncultured Mailhella sp.]|uniref:Crp/Fnr family transcriptional regulator n=1 Tax=uncultured Mailhella sp. TaxID=1981031 RepID=UPI0025F999AC|nr:Crp/Fnr family transcriptional regulator [uncultured Mailhella sp.]